MTHLVIEQRNRCFYYVFVTFGVMAITSILKLLDHEPRPFWIKDTPVQAFLCSYGYGNPSEHASVAASASIAIALDFYAWLKP